VIWRVPNFPEQIRSSLDRQVLSDLREGLHWLWKEPVIKILIVVPDPTFPLRHLV